MHQQLRACMIRISLKEAINKNIYEDIFALFLSHELILKQL